jgi:hypothetical protein
LLKVPRIVAVGPVAERAAGLKAVKEQRRKTAARRRRMRWLGFAEFMIAGVADAWAVTDESP